MSLRYWAKSNQYEVTANIDGRRKKTALEKQRLDDENMAKLEMFNTSSALNNCSTCTAPQGRPNPPEHRSKMRMVSGERGL